MLTLKEHLDKILDAARNVGSKEFQERAWFPGSGLFSSPTEIYSALMDDWQPQRFFEEFSHNFSETQMRRWTEFRDIFDRYYDKYPGSPDPRTVLADPDWEMVRQAAQKFVEAFSGPTSGGC